MHSTLTDPALITTDGRLWWHWASGDRVPYIGGGAEDGDAGDDKGEGENSGDDADEGDTEDKGEDGDEKKADDSLGDAGKQALDRMKAKWQAERDKRKEAEAKLAGSGDDKDADAIQREADVKAQAKANERILRSEIKAAAAGKLADPADALRLLDLSTFEVDEDGSVDEDEIAEAIDDLIEKKPYLAAVQDGKRFKGKADGGTRKESGPAQLSEADVKRLYAEKKYDEIDKARKEGRLSKMLAGS